MTYLSKERAETLVREFKEWVKSVENIQSANEKLGIELTHICAPVGVVCEESYRVALKILEYVDPTTLSEVGLKAYNELEKNVIAWEEKAKDSEVRTDR